MIELDSVEKLTEFLNRPKKKEWIEFCKSDLDFYYKIQFEGPLTILRFSERTLKNLESLIKAKELDKKEIYDLIRFEILFDLKAIRHCREALEFLEEKQYLSFKKIKSFQKEFDKMEALLLEYTVKFAKVGICQN